MVNLLDLNHKQMQPIRQEISMIFQDPINSLNPRMTVSDIVAEPMVIHGKYHAPEVRRSSSDCSSGLACARITCAVIRTSSRVGRSSALALRVRCR